MSDADFTQLTAKASALISAGNPDAAIDLLRIPASNEQGDLATLLARAYHMRGDTKGDVYASHFFAARARALGRDSNEMIAIQAIGDFRKGNYGEAVTLFASYVDDASPAATRYIYALCLLHSGAAADAIVLLKALVADEKGNTDYKQALEAAQTGTTRQAPTPLAPLPTPALGGLRETRPTDVDSPYAFSALSKLSGTATTAKDHYWLEKNIPCQAACPAGTDIPDYLTAIYDGDTDRAYRINLRDNVFPAVLGRVCARPCEPECRHGWEGLGESVAICFSKRSAADFAKQREPVLLDPLFPPSGKRVAVVGAGVAGLAAARQLALYGHQVTVYEKHARPGGMMNQGIPAFRLPRHHIDHEIQQIRLLGVEIICGTSIGTDLPVDQLVAEHDAIVMAAGTLRPNLLDLPGKELQGVVHGLDFLLEVNDTGDGPIGRDVVVIGGGFTAMDCARTAARLGAKLSTFNAENDDWRDASLLGTGAAVNVLYRRSVGEMLVTPGEIEELEHEQIGMDILVSPVAYIPGEGDASDRVKAVRFIRNELGEPDASGRRRPLPVAGSEFDVPADLVLLATGQFPDTNWIQGELRKALVDDDQWLTRDAVAGTAHDKLFAAGDFATGARSLIDAIGHAKDCARQVDTYLNAGIARLEDVALIEDTDITGRIREMDAVELQPMPTIPLEARSLESEVETGFTPELAVDETQRCYRCHFKYEIDSDKCIYCDWCVKAKPRPDCIVKVSALEYGPAGEITGFKRATGSDDTRLIYINQEDCIRCGACVDACPVDCISIQKVSLSQRPCGGKE